MKSTRCVKAVDKALLDTDIFSEILKGIDQKVVAKATAYRATFGHYTISVITVMEIVKGFHKLQREDRIQQFLAGLPTIELLTLDLRSSGCLGEGPTYIKRNLVPQDVVTWW